MRISLVTFIKLFCLFFVMLSNRGRPVKNQKNFKEDGQIQELKQEIEIKQEQIERLELELKEKEDVENQRNKKYIQLAFTIFISVAVAYVLESLIIYLPGNPIGAIQWVVACLFIIGLTLGVIFYVLDYFPKFNDKDIWLRTSLLISMAMTFLGFVRYHRFLNKITLQTEKTSASFEILTYSYNTWLLFLLLSGLILFTQGKIYPKDKKYEVKRAVFMLLGIIISVVSVLVMVFLQPTGQGGGS